MESLLDVVIRALIYSTIGFAVHLVYASARYLDFFLGTLLTICTYLLFSFLQFKIPFTIAVLTAIAMGIVLTLLLNHFVYRPLRKRKVPSWQMLIASLGIYVALQNLISLIWSDSTLSFRTWPVEKGHYVLGINITDVEIITLVGCTFLLGLIRSLLKNTHTGLKIRAMSSNPQLANIIGISQDKVIFWSYALGAGLTACIGILIAADTDITPTMGFNWLVYAVVAMIIGGIGKLRYIVLSALLLATAQHLAAYYLDNRWMNAVAYLILIAFLNFLPYGFGSTNQLKTRI